MRHLITGAMIVAFAGPAMAQGTEVTAEIWVDNWFALHVNGAEVAEDSTPYRTERSFNADRVTFDATMPMTVAVELRDFMEDDTGLEYIGTNRQQMGDGGAILQFAVAGQVIGVSDASWRCLVVHTAPLDTACADESNPELGSGSCSAEISAYPEGWTKPGFDDSAWAAATEQSERDVSPKDGYDRVSWDAAARLIWSPDLVRDNIVLCRATIG